MYSNEDSRYNGQRNVAVRDLRKASRAGQIFPIIILIVTIGDTSDTCKVSTYETKFGIHLLQLSLYVGHTLPPTKEKLGGGGGCDYT